QQEIIVHCLLERLGMVKGGLQFTGADATVLANTNIESLITAPKIMAALYKGPGTGGNGPPNLLELFNSRKETSLTEVTPQQIRDGVLTNYDVVIFAGGSGSKEA